MADVLARRRPPLASQQPGDLRANVVTATSQLGQGTLDSCVGLDVAPIGSAAEPLGVYAGMVVAELATRSTRPSGLGIGYPRHT